MAELGTKFSIVAKSYCFPTSDSVSNKLYLVAITRGKRAISPSLRELDSDQDFVMTKCGKLCVLVFHAPPN